MDTKKSCCCMKKDEGAVNVGEKPQVIKKYDEQEVNGVNKTQKKETEAANNLINKDHVVIDIGF